MQPPPPPADLCHSLIPAEVENGSSSVSVKPQMASHASLAGLASLHTSNSSLRRATSFSTLARASSLDMANLKFVLSWLSEIEMNVFMTQQRKYGGEN